MSCRPTRRSPPRAACDWTLDPSSLPCVSQMSASVWTSFEAFLCVVRRSTPPLTLSSRRALHLPGHFTPTTDTPPPGQKLCPTTLHPTRAPIPRRIAHVCSLPSPSPPFLLWCRGLGVSRTVASKRKERLCSDPRGAGPDPARPASCSPAEAFTPHARIPFGPDPVLSAAGTPPMQ